MGVTRKTEVGPLDGTPVKRMFWSIISDYDLRTGVCELLDNAIDLWTLQGRKRALAIDVMLDADRQFIAVHDNAGGVKHDELRLLIAPGGSRNQPHDEVIGIFGVGGKRASIALGEHVEIKTRHRNKETFQLDITRDWLEIDDWQLPVYTIPSIEPGTTTVEISKLRKPFLADDIPELRGHLGETYAWFLRNGCTLALNGTPVLPREFDHWAYPPDYPPTPRRVRRDPPRRARTCGDHGRAHHGPRPSDRELWRLRLL